MLSQFKFQKILTILFCFQYAVLTADAQIKDDSIAPITEPVALIVGFCGPVELLPNYINNCLYGAERQYFNHKSLCYKVHTLDLNPCVIPEKVESHIIADATTVDLRAHRIQQIGHLVIERLNTASFDNPFDNINLGCIENLSPYMTSYAELTIEWEPWINLIIDPKKKTFEKDNERNPFTGFIPLILFGRCITLLQSELESTPAEKAVCLTLILTQPQFRQHTPPELECINKFYPFVRGCIEFMVNAGLASKENIIQRLSREMDILTQLHATERDVTMPFDLSKISVEDFLTRYPTSYNENQNASDSFSYDWNDFLNLSLLKVVLRDVVTQSNFPLIKPLLEENGFENVTLYRGDNHLNGRKNIWMINASKKPIKKIINSSVDSNPPRYSLNIKNKYKKALEHKQRKNIEKAMEIFLDLADQHDHKHAAHEYALIQQQLSNYRIAKRFFLKAGLPESINSYNELIDQEACLILGSNRSGGIPDNPIGKILYNAGNQNISHIESFEGKAITLDLLPVYEQADKFIKKKSPKIKYTHIIADAQTVDWRQHSNRPIRHLFLERLPSISMKKLDNDTINSLLNSNDLHQGCLRNLAPHMDPGALLTIEWDPYICFIANCDAESNIESLNVRHPFTGWMNYNCFILSIQYFIEFYPNGCIDNHPDMQSALSKTKDLTIIEDFTIIDQEARYINNCIIFMVNQKLASREEIIERIKAELNVWMDSSSNHSFIVFPFNFDTLEFNEFKQQAQNITHIVDAQSITYMTEIASISDTDIANKKIMCTEDFFRETILYILMQDVAVRKNFAEVKRLIEECGFEDITLYRRNNPFNNRKNRWMIEATKSGEL